MPLEKLQTYQGRNPHPADFDEYWSRALNELTGVNPDIELIPAKFQVKNAECFDLYFTGTKGARIHAKYLRPKNAQNCPAVLQFHGYSGNAGDWQDKLSYVSQGFCVAAMDCRGQGGLSEDTSNVRGNTHRGHIIRGLDDHPDNLLFRQIFLDTVQLAKIVMNFNEVDENRVGTMGNSQGGALAIVCAALEPRIKRISSLHPFLSDYKRVWEMDLAKNAFEELTTYFRLFDPLHEREDEIFTTLGYIDIQHLANRVKGEVLMGCGLMDTVCPPSIQFAMYNKLQSPKNVLIYPEYAHEGKPGFSDRTMQFMLGL